MPSPGTHAHQPRPGGSAGHFNAGGDRRWGSFIRRPWHDGKSQDARHTAPGIAVRRECHGCVPESQLSRSQPARLKDAAMHTGLRCQVVTRFTPSLDIQSRAPFTERLECDPRACRPWHCRDWYPWKPPVTFELPVQQRGGNGPDTVRTSCWQRTRPVSMLLVGPDQGACFSMSLFRMRCARDRALRRAMQAQPPTTTSA